MRKLHTPAGEGAAEVIKTRGACGSTQTADWRDGIDVGESVCANVLDYISPLYWPESRFRLVLPEVYNCWDDV